MLMHTSKCYNEKCNLAISFETIAGVQSLRVVKSLAFIGLSMQVLMLFLRMLLQMAMDLDLGNNV